MARTSKKVQAREELAARLARHAATLNRVAPGAAEKVRAAFEDMKAQGVSLENAGWRK
ncbi:hypothetical protein ACIGFJ_14365 [Brevundimonas diminuta]|uniref:hypothetical protein n=1 Tax=Brevundimonas diminuta TaxID=293 RepID=UPI0037C966CC